MAHKHRKPPKKVDNSFRNSLIFYLTSFVTLVVLGFTSISKGGAAFMATLYMRVIVKLLLNSMIIVGAIQNCKGTNSSFLKRVILCIYLPFALTFWLAFLLPARINVLILLLLFLTDIILTIWATVRQEEVEYIRIPIILGAMGIILLLGISRAVPVNLNLAMIFISALAAIASAISIVLCFKYFKDKLYRKRDKAGIIFGSLIICFFASFFLIIAFNYVFDFRKPESINAEVLKMRVSSGPRQPTTFNCTIEIEGKEVEIEVPNTLYYDLTIGSDLEIQLYKGALGFKYYIYEDSTSSKLFS